ncbi:MAG: hypothetical protein EOO03_06870, partial [Chitinophagaceae bacterium]
MELKMNLKSTMDALAFIIQSHTKGIARLKFTGQKKAGVIEMNGDINLQHSAIEEIVEIFR